MARRARLSQTDAPMRNLLLRFRAPGCASCGSACHTATDAAPHIPNNRSLWQHHISFPEKGKGIRPACSSRPATTVFSIVSGSCTPRNRPKNSGMGFGHFQAPKPHFSVIFVRTPYHCSRIDNTGTAFGPAPRPIRTRPAQHCLSLARQRPVRPTVGGRRSHGREAGAGGRPSQ